MVLSGRKSKITLEGNFERNNTGRKPFNQRRLKEASLGKQRRKIYLTLHGLSKLYKDSEDSIITTRITLLDRLSRKGHLYVSAFVASLGLDPLVVEFIRLEPYTDSGLDPLL